MRGDSGHARSGAGAERKKPVLLVQHAPHEHPAAIRRALESQGIVTQWIHPYRGEAYPRSSEVRGLISLGGPMGANDEDLHPWIAPEIRLMHECVEARIPVVGICLGGQMLARALGSKVEKNRTAEIGWFPLLVNDEGEKDPIVGAAGPEPVVYHWHEDTFHLPESAVLLAQSRNCPRQAYRVGELAYGFQFHPEADHQLVNEWLSVEGTEEDIARARRKNGAKSVQAASVHRSLALEGEKSSLKITASLAQLFRDTLYDPIDPEIYERMEKLATRRTEYVVEFEGSERKAVRLKGTIMTLMTIPSGEFMIFRERDSLLWPIRLDHVRKITPVK